MILNYKKNTFKSIIHDIKITPELFAAYIHNASNNTETIQKPISKKYIQLYFCTQGTIKIQLQYSDLSIHNLESILIYNPSQDLPIHLNIGKNSAVLTILITVDQLYQLFGNQIQNISFLSKSEINQDFQIKTPFDFDLLQNIVFFEHYKYHDDFKSIYYKAKISELLIQHWNNPDFQIIKNNYGFSEEAQVRKVKAAHDLMLQNMASPLTINDLAEKVELSPFKLKMHFKVLYKETIYHYLLAYKLEYSKKLLRSTNLTIQEIAYQIGYENPSHYIAAFKKKYAITPKKYKLLQDATFFS